MFQRPMTASSMPPPPPRAAGRKRPALEAVPEMCARRTPTSPSPPERVVADPPFPNPYQLYVQSPDGSLRHSGSRPNDAHQQFTGIRLGFHEAVHSGDMNPGEWTLVWLDTPMESVSTPGKFYVAIAVRNEHLVAPAMRAATQEASPMGGMQRTMMPRSAAASGEQMCPMPTHRSLAAAAPAQDPNVYTECPVCMDPANPLSVMLAPCGHSFCRGCYENPLCVITTKKECPVCKRGVVSAVERQFGGLIPETPRVDMTVEQAPLGQPITVPAAEATPTVAVHMEVNGVSMEQMESDTSTIHGVIQVDAPSFPEAIMQHHRDHGHGADVVALLDLSSSMGWEYAGHPQGSMPKLRNAVRLLVNTLGDHDRLSIITFTCEAEVKVGLIPMTAENKDTIIETLVTNERGLVANGGTNIGAGLRKVADVLNLRAQTGSWVGRRTSVILMSDGQCRHPVPSMTVLDPQMRGLCEIHSIGLTRDHDKAKLEGIAQMGGGIYQFLEVAEHFDEAVVGLVEQTVFGRVVNDLTVTAEVVGLDNEVLAGATAEVALLQPDGTLAGNQLSLSGLSAGATAQMFCALTITMPEHVRQQVSDAEPQQLAVRVSVSDPAELDVRFDRPLFAVGPQAALPSVEEDESNIVLKQVLTRGGTQLMQELQETFHNLSPEAAGELLTRAQLYLDTRLLEDRLPVQLREMEDVIMVRNLLRDSIRDFRYQHDHRYDYSQDGDVERTSSQAAENYRHLTRASSGTTYRTPSMRQASMQ